MGVERVRIGSEPTCPYERSASDIVPAPAGDRGVSPYLSSSPPTMPSLLGGSYRIIELLEEGGMGRLYRAEHVRLRRPIAVKVLAHHLAHSPAALLRFQREAEIISQLHHPHVVHVLDFDTTEAGEPFIVMELLEGETLRVRLEREGVLPLDDILTIITQIASALAAAHQVGIIHRDLKPENIFLLQVDRGSLVCKLLDFGISKRTTGGTNVTGEFELLGTPAYMAPEQAIPASPVDHRADEFALATIAYELLTGRQPFGGDSIPEIIHRLTHEAPPPMSVFTKQVPLPVESVILRALSKSPEDRFLSVPDFASALSQAAGQCVPGRTKDGRRSSSTVKGAVLASLPSSQLIRAARSTAPVLRPDTSPVVRGAPHTRRSSAPSLPEGRSIPSPIPEPSHEDIQQKLADCRQAAAFGEQQRAVGMARTLLRMARRSADPRALALVRESSALLEPLFFSELGKLSTIVSFVKDADVKSTRITPEHAYLLSRVTEPVTIEEFLDISPLSRVETLAFLVELTADGVLSLS